MRRFIFLFLLLTATSTIAQNGAGDVWPKLTKGDKAQCKAVMQLATSVFNSTSYSLYDPPQLPQGFDSALVLGPNAIDISGGNAIQADESVFKKITIEHDRSAPNAVYWQQKAAHGYRIVVVDMPFSWRGDWYSLFSVPENMTPAEVLAQVKNEREIQGAAYVLHNSWRPPVIQRKADGELWMVDVGQPYESLGAWRVYFAEPEGLNLRCSVQFGPPTKSSINLLPQPIRRLESLLDQTMGSGEEEGTLRPTAALRGNVNHVWGNAALRPWTVGDPYNTRAEVDAALQIWAATGPSYKKLYQAIQRQYPLAERSLAQYYRTKFKLSEAEAKAAAAYVLDVAYRSHYSFHSEEAQVYSRTTSSGPNPFPILR